MLKVSEAKTQDEKWAEPYVKKFKTKCTCRSVFKPFVYFLLYMLSHTSEHYPPKQKGLPSKSVVSPHITMVQEIGNPHHQDVKMFSKSYVDQVATATRPHVDNIKVT